MIYVTTTENHLQEICSDNKSDALENLNYE